MTDKNPVSLSPSSFTDESEQDRLIALSCEEVVDFKVSQESARTLQMAEECECEGRVNYRSVPAGLLQALDALAQHKSRSRRLVTKCLAHHAVALMSTFKEIDEINRIYKEILALHGRCGKLTSLLEQMDNQQFLCLNERPVKGEFRAAGKLISYFSDRASGLGIDTSTFMSIGFEWSLTTSQSDNLIGAVRELHPGVADFRQYVFERSVLMRAYKAIANSRIGALDGKNTNCKST